MPALADTAKAQGAGGQVDQGIVDASAAEGYPVLHIGDISLIGGEDVERQGAGMGADFLYRLLQGMVSQDRQERSENLLSHDRVFPGNVIHQSGGDPQLFFP